MQNYSAIKKKKEKKIIQIRSVVSVVVICAKDYIIVGTNITCE